MGPSPPSGWAMPACAASLSIFRPKKTTFAEFKVRVATWSVATTRA